MANYIQCCIHRIIITTNFLQAFCSRVSQLQSVQDVQFFLLQLNNQNLCFIVTSLVNINANIKSIYSLFHFPSPSVSALSCVHQQRLELLGEYSQGFATQLQLIQMNKPVLFLKYYKLPGNFYLYDFLSSALSRMQLALKKAYNSCSIPYMDDIMSFLFVQCSLKVFDM